jgi:RNA methyltransferase, TrmH family
LPILSKNKFAYFRSLQQKKIRQKENKFLIEGVKLCYEALAADIYIHAFLFCHQQFSDDKVLNDLTSLCDKKSIPYFDISQAMLKSLSDTVTSQGIIGVVSRPDSIFNPQKMNFILALDNAQEPGNVGTIIRTADWFGVNAILLSENSVEIANPKVIRATMGSIFHIPIFENIKLISKLNELKKDGFSIYATDAKGELDLKKVTYSFKKILVVGNESQGITSEIFALADKILTIPRQGQAESLNLAIATAIALNEMAQQHG